MIARKATRGSSGFLVRRFGGFTVVELPAGRNFLMAPALAGELCAALDAGDATGLIVDLSSSGLRDSAQLEALMRAARRARDWGSWLRLVIPDAEARKLVRLVAMDEVMPMHTSVPEAIAAAGAEATITRPAASRCGGHQPVAVAGWRQEGAAAWDR